MCYLLTSIFQTNGHSFRNHVSKSRCITGSNAQHLGHVPLGHTHHSLQQPYTGQWSSQLPASWDQEKRASWVSWLGQNEQVGKYVPSFYMLLAKFIALNFHHFLPWYLSSVLCLSEIVSPQEEQAFHIWNQQRCRRVSDGLFFKNPTWICFRQYISHHLLYVSIPNL